MAVKPTISAKRMLQVKRERNFFNFSTADEFRESRGCFLNGRMDTMTSATSFNYPRGIQFKHFTVFESSFACYKLETFALVLFLLVELLLPYTNLNKLSNHSAHTEIERNRCGKL